MKTSTRFFAWHPVLTDHQAFTYQALSECANAPVTAYVMQIEDATRQAQGWRDTQVTSIQRQLIPTVQSLRYCYRQLLAHRHDVHFFGSAFERPVLIICLLIAAWLRIRFYLISEPYSPKAFGYLTDQRKIVARTKTVLRPVLYWLYIHVLRSRLSGIFAISELALTQFHKAGLSKSKLFPFGYFIPRASLPRPQDEGTCLRIVFVGALIQRKGLDVLIGAVKIARNSGADVMLDVFGPGDPKAFSMQEPNINYRGLIPFGQAQERIADYHLMVLPSHYDGWGVVVNESLCAGVPVVCSNQVGASVLLNTFKAGATFACGDSQALADLLLRLSQDRPLLQQMQRNCVAAADAIQPAVAASYMFDVVTAADDSKDHIPSPWYKSS